MVSLFLYRQPGTEVYLKLFSPFLGITFLVEVYGRYLRYQGRNNLLLYSFFTTIEFIFYLYLLSCIIHTIKIRLTVRYILVFNAVIALVNTLFIQKNEFNSISYSLSCLFVVSFCIYYFFELFRYPKFVNLIYEPPFWICSGLLFYYCCSFPLFAVLSFLSSVPRSLLDNLFVLVNVINTFLYAMFMIAFICRIKVRRPVSSS